MSDIKKLQYEIFKYSSYSTSYLPENIRENCPSNQTSRWSSNTNTPPQFLILKLQRPAVVKRIKFGKYEKTHVCNLKKFKIFGGLEEEHMVLLFEGGLVNDSTPETFNLRHTTESGSDLFPVMFIKIMPLLSWGPCFNFSIWYVELHGQDDQIYVRSSLKTYNMLREVEIVKLCLKHFRQQGYNAAFKALQEQTNVVLEHEIMSDLYKCLVDDGDFEKTEQFITNCVHDGLIDDHLTKQDYKVYWSLVNVKSEIRPGVRGGHQMVIDSKKGHLYLYGGWDGYEDLSDLWRYDIGAKSWELLHECSDQHGGPSPRSCHKMVFDPVSEQIFTIGRYIDNSVRSKEYMKSDFYLFDINTNSWLQICDDTSQVGGPLLMYDHQLAIDTDKRTIYVFGGKILTPRSISNMSSTESEHSGLFSYHIATNTWTQILVDCSHPTASNPDVASIKSRVTHCMVFHNKKRKLYIFGGQRGKDDVTDFMAYDVDTQKVEILNLDTSNSNMDNKSEPLPGFTQRATIDTDTDEIYVFASLNKQKEKRDVKTVLQSNSFWTYSLISNSWSCVYKSDHTLDLCHSKYQNSFQEPCPRYAHQFVHDQVNKIHYLFGGNPGKASHPQLRLDDFWTLNLTKPSRDQKLRQCKFLIRRLKYEEIARDNPVEAIYYLQNKVSEVIDHSDPIQLDSFHKLALLIFKHADYPADESSLLTFPIDVKSEMKTKKQDNDDTEPMVSADYTDDCYNTNSTTDDSEYLSIDNNSSSRLARCKRRSPQQNYCDPDFYVKNQRCFLFNKLAELMPDVMVQPKGNLSDFVLI